MFIPRICLIDYFTNFRDTWDDMSNNFVERFCHRDFQKNPKKDKTEVIKNLTHLYLNGHKLEEIGQLTCTRLKVLYLHNNCIQRIFHLDELTQLTHLFLQWNKIEKIENLQHLKQLKKLYLGYNRIHRLEGIDQLNALEELHLERQQLDNEPFSFDPKSLFGISDSLRVLNISGLALNDLSFLELVPNIIDLIATDNRIENAIHIGDSIKQLHYLQRAQFIRCPAQLNDVHYRSKIISASNSLVTLDNKPIKEVYRKFLENFAKVKAEQSKKGKPILFKTVDIDLRDDSSLFEHIDELPFDLSNVVGSVIDDITNTLAAETE